MAQVHYSTDYDEVFAYVNQHGDNARILEEITRQLDDDYHTVWLDGHFVWHAWNEPGENEWYLDHETAGEALTWLREQLDGQGVFDRIADPSRYSEPAEARYVTSDEDAMEEFYDVELAALAHDLPDEVTPREVDQVIQARINRARAEAARLASLRAHHVRATFQGNGERGWKAAAARSLRITPVSLGDVLKDDEARAARRRESAARATNDDYLT
jgi:hypothetical protein